MAYPILGTLNSVQQWKRSGMLIELVPLLYNFSNPWINLTLKFTFTKIQLIREIPWFYLNLFNLAVKGKLSSNTGC